MSSIPAPEGLANSSAVQGQADFKSASDALAASEAVQGRQGLTSATEEIANRPNSGNTAMHPFLKQREQGGREPRSQEMIESETNDKAPKRSVALMIGYNGKRFSGLQRNYNALTVEDEIEAAIHKAGGILTSNLNNFARIHWTRAARTDKGVHAVANVVSLRMMMPTNEKDMGDCIRMHLPDDIMMFGDVLRVTKNFNAHLQASSRRYEYILPTYCLAKIDAPPMEPRFIRPKGTQTEITGPTAKALHEQFVTEGKVEAALGPSLPIDEVLEAVGVPETTPPFDYRWTKEDEKRINDILSLYVGTHNFHNFTSGKPSTDPSARREIFSFKVDDVFILEGIEYASLVVHGASFVLHQIRKMVGLAMFACRYEGSIDSRKVIKSAFSDIRLAIPKVPGDGLMLNAVDFEIYNRNKGGVDGRALLDASKYRDEMRAFKIAKLYPDIAKREKEEHLMHQYSRHLHGLYYLYHHEAPVWPTHEAPVIANPKGHKRKKTREDKFNKKMKANAQAAEDGVTNSDDEQGTRSGDDRM